MRLKSRTKFPPGQFCLLLPEIGMKQPVSGSFNECVDAFALIVKRNPAQAQRYNWPTDRANQELFVEDQNARRLVAAGWPQFVESSDPSAPVQYSPVISKKNFADPVAAAKSAAAAYKDLFVNGPVAQDLAEHRASICSSCPKNNVNREFGELFVESIASTLRSLVSLVHDMGMKTSRDSKLGICTACGCPLRSKVFVDIKIASTKLTPDAWNQLDPGCWLLSETGKT